MGRELKWTAGRRAWEREHCRAYLTHFGGPVPLDEDDEAREGRARVATDFDLSRLFDAYDVDGSGRISEVELKQVSAGLGHVLSDEQVKDCLATCDTDGDGYVSKEEFIDWWNSDSSNPNLKRLKHAQATLGSIEGSGALFG